MPIDEDLSKFQRSELSVKRWTIGIAACVAVVGLLNYNHQVNQSKEQVDQFNFQQSQQIKQFSDKFNADQNAQAEQREKEYRVKFYERQADAYFELCDVVAKIATSQPPQKNDVTRFDQMLIGKLGIVADEQVMHSVTRFNKKLRGKEPPKMTPSTKVPVKMPGPDFIPTPPHKDYGLNELAYLVSQACRHSLQKAFPGVGLGTPTSYGALGPVGPEGEP